eukprot:7178182-Prymnesium_polylepis.1
MFVPCPSSVAQVSDRLRLHRGARYNKKTKEKRPYVFDQAITRREKFDATAAMSGQLAPGDRATSRGRPCRVVEIDHEANTCKLSFAAHGVEAT